jgi:hypothetical protein
MKKKSKKQSSQEIPLNNDLDFQMWCDKVERI